VRQQSHSALEGSCIGKLQTYVGRQTPLRQIGDLVGVQSRNDFADHCNLQRLADKEDTFRPESFCDVVYLGDVEENIFGENFCCSCQSDK